MKEFVFFLRNHKTTYDKSYYFSTRTTVFFLIFYKVFLYHTDSATSWKKKVKALQNVRLMEKFNL